MLASLRMYDLPEVRSATDAWWRGVAAALERAGLESVPASLNWDANIDVLRSPELLLGQTCGYPLTHALADVVDLVATPAYSADGCSGADYCSLIVVSEDNSAAALAALRGAVCAYSRRDSHSGYNALRAAIAPLADGDVARPDQAEHNRDDGDRDEDGGDRRHYASSCRTPDSTNCFRPSVKSRPHPDSRLLRFSSLM